MTHFNIVFVYTLTYFRFTFPNVYIFPTSNRLLINGLTFLYNVIHKTLIRSRVIVPHKLMVLNDFPIYYIYIFLKLSRQRQLIISKKSNEIVFSFLSLQINPINERIIRRQKTLKKFLFTTTNEIAKRTSSIVLA